MSTNPKEYQKNKSKNFRDILRARGLCPRCGANPPYKTRFKEYASCKECLKERANYQLEYNRRKRASLVE